MLCPFICIITHTHTHTHTHTLSLSHCHTHTHTHKPLILFLRHHAVEEDMNFSHMIFVLVIFVILPRPTSLLAPEGLSLRRQFLRRVFRSTGCGSPICPNSSTSVAIQKCWVNAAADSDCIKGDNKLSHNEIFPIPTKIPERLSSH